MEFGKYRLYTAKGVNASKASQNPRNSIGCKLAPKNANIIRTTEYQST